MRKTILSAAIIATVTCPASARDLAFECRDAGAVGVASMNLFAKKQAQAENIIKDAADGKIERSAAIEQLIPASDAVLASLASWNISLKFLIDNNCSPQDTQSLKAKLADNISALNDLRDERQQFDTLRSASK
jgi:hypothetical protein